MRDLLLYADEDAYRFRLLIEQLRDIDGELSDFDTRELSLEVVRSLLREDLVYLSDWDDESGRFYPWRLSGENCVARIANEYDIKTIDSQVDEIVWFFITPKGRQWVNSYYRLLEDLDPPTRDE